MEKSKKLNSEEKKSKKTSPKLDETKKNKEETLNNRDSSYVFRAKHITKYYGKTEVLRDISFDVKEGERIAIVGANGAGKSTLSEIIAQIKEPTSGELYYSFGKTKSEISSKIGIQFQDSSYPDFYKVKDLVDFMIDVSDVHISKEDLNNLYKQFDLFNLIREYAKGLSGGQQQRLNILLAIVHNPKLIILDEVGTGLDVESRTKIKSYIKDYLANHKATLLLVSHNADEVTELVDRVIVIHDGEIFEDKPLKEILSKWEHFDNFMNNLYLNVFKDKVDSRVNKTKQKEDKRQFKDDKKRILRDIEIAKEEGKTKEVEKLEKKLEKLMKENSDFKQTLIQRRIEDRRIRKESKEAKKARKKEEKKSKKAEKLGDKE
ncbi:MAG: hypothetical protein HPAVJP_1100 [Candidatus Hepatoplasma vulgare]|nr:MAG: hypothetical protein HPAVJP_1100 [Candidatus Hepatoplasma sp.]